MLSDSALEEIRRELTNLHQFKAQVEDRIRVLEAVLVPLDLAQIILPFSLGMVSPSASMPTHQTAEAKITHGAYASTGLRAAILDVLKTRGPIRSPDVATLLAEKGFAEGSATPLTTRVYNDLWRMKKKGLVTSEYGSFRLIKKLVQNESGQ